MCTGNEKGNRDAGGGELKKQTEEKEDEKEGDAIAANGRKIG